MKVSEGTAPIDTGNELGTDPADRSYPKISEKGERADAEHSFTRRGAAIFYPCFLYIIDPSGLRTIGTKRL